jgi:PAS domain S-box-containing protein
MINNEKCILSSTKGVTLHKKVEDVLQESDDCLGILNRAMGEAIFVVKFPEQIVEYLNDAAISIFGYEKQEVMGNSIRLFYPDQEGHLRSGGIFQDALKQGNAVIRFEAVLKRKDGEAFPAFFTATFLKESNDVTKFIVIVQDITEQKRNNDKVRQLHEQLEQRVTQRTLELNNAQTALLNLVDDLNQSANNLTSANHSLAIVNKELESFSYSVSHDLRAPLRSIDGFSSALLEDYYDKLDDSGKDYLQRIHKAAQHMDQLISDILKLSRLTQSALIRRAVDLSKMVKDIAETYEQKEPTKKTILIQEGVIVRADRRLMHIALTNLLDNAWKFTGKEGHPQIEFGTTLQDGKVVIFIRDNGVGFDMTYADKLFGAFQRLHRADEFPGTGIGLATVRRIINRHGGQIWGQGEQGKGATFFSTLPE